MQAAPTGLRCALAAFRTPSPSATTRRPTGPARVLVVGGHRSFDRVRYEQRNQVERLMNRRKQFRAVATRYDRLACRYQATVTIADLFIWLRARPDQPRRDPSHAP